MFSKLTLLALCATLGFTASAQAAIKSYSDQSSFAAAISASATDSFDDLTSGSLSVQSLTRSAGSYSYTAAEPNGLLYIASSGTDQWLSAGEASDIFRFSSFSGGASAIGGFFFTTDMPGSADGYALTITVTTADGNSLSSELKSTSASTYLGFTSDSAITSLSVSSPNAVADKNGYATVNDLTLGVAAVPEPAGYALLLAGLGMLGVVSRRRR